MISTFPAGAATGSGSTGGKEDCPHEPGWYWCVDSDGAAGFEPRRVNRDQRTQEPYVAAPPIAANECAIYLKGRQRFLAVPLPNSRVFSRTATS